MVKPENPRRNFFLRRKRKGQAALEYMNEQNKDMEHPDRS